MPINKKTDKNYLMMLTETKDWNNLIQNNNKKTGKLELKKTPL